MTQHKQPDLDAFKDLPLEELEQMQTKLQSFLAKKRDMEKKEALQEIRKLVQAHDLDYEEVLRAIRTTAKRGKAPALYRNPDNPRQTWSGKGEAPDWYTQAPDKSALKIPNE